MTPPHPHVPTPIALREASHWCEAALFQGRRLKELLDSQVAFEAATAMPAEWRALRGANLLPGGGRVEVVEGYFFTAALATLLEWLAAATRDPRDSPKAVRSARRDFVHKVPAPPALHKLLWHGYTVADHDLPDFDEASLRAARGRDYKVPGGISLAEALKALEALAPVLAAHRPG